MLFKQTHRLGFVIVVVSLSVMLFMSAGCSKTGNHEGLSEESETSQNDQLEKSAPEGMETEMTETEKTETEAEDTYQGGNPVVLMETSLGNFKIELFQNRAPVSVSNFLDYVNEGFYEGTIFHRVIPNFVIQGGGFTEDMEKKNTHPPIKNEARNGIGNTKGTVAMARTQIVNSATSQFYINLKDNPFLDHRDETNQGYGYCVFGRIIEGMDVVEMIGRTPTSRKGRHENVPIKPVIIKSARVLHYGG